ncbi:MAG TPA: HAMP domain-containing sensor histidine kinase [Candidatus Goldiibacteriota bacterium]|nr:HAMP domain-containing sensor histidine kinase [Candidatus Goldiibacteriota bacterium]HPI03514.1 HAMP domain-containing sensor histidine kinase [Candidatus Goldiibacteriota bacterium]HPN64724.1 HAMP domain-containing sensor histidine kinase [Candidatus Goldiibacteriota bacterium]HRQ44373.1 HAMP domain-containing sensor histidine kinase [Candidatus Goldiibacteriota bacterium]
MMLSKNTGKPALITITVLSSAAVVFSVYMFLFQKSFYAAFFAAAFLAISILSTYALMIMAKNEQSIVLESPLNDIDSKETMIAAVAHEIKNPLNSIKGANQYLHDKYKSKQDIYEFTGIVVEEITRLERYLNEFLSFSRGVKPHMKKHDIQTFTTGILMITKHNFPYGIKIVSEKPKLPDVYMDAEQMKQVMVNLLNNAKDATAGRSSPRVEIRLSSDDRYVYVKVADNGCGISKKDLSRISTPFYTTKKEGMGIGLAISRSIIKKHGGDLSIESKVNKGSVFTISIPVEKRSVKR